MPFKPGSIRRAPLAFIEPAPNPMQGMSKDGTHEEQAAEQLTRLQQGFRDRAKAERFRMNETTRSDYHFTVVFEHGDQAVAFLAKAGYRENTAMYVDGPMLAEALGIELPPTPFKLRKLRPADRSLRHLVTVIPKRSGLTGDPE